MFYRSANLDKDAEDKIQNLNAAYTKIEEILTTLPEGRAVLFAQTNLDQSYMWAIRSVEEAMLEKKATPVQPKAPMVTAPPVQPKAPMAAPVPAPAPVIPPPIAPSIPMMPTIPIPTPTTDADILAQSTVQLDSLMTGIKELTDIVKISGFPIK